MLRSFFLFLSQQRTLRRWFETSPLSGKLTKRFVAGQRLEDALAVAQRLHAEKILTTLDRLGENVTTIAEAAVARDNYVAGLQKLIPLNIGGTVSIKLTQFGLDFSVDACLENVRPLVAIAKAGGSRIEIDMESSEYTDRTLEVVRRLHQEFGCVRSVIQAYLKRTAGDIDSMCQAGIPVRLCKGAYDEPETVALASKAAVDANYVAQTKVLLDRGAYPAIATHDEKMIAATVDHVKARGIRPDQFEFQMLYGIRRDLQARLVQQGYRLRLYVPYGEAWYPYFMRRLAERPANVFFLVRNLVRK